MNRNDKIDKFVLLIGSIITVIAFAVIIMCFTSCQALPQFFSTAEDIADDTAIKTEISKEAIQRNTNVHLYIDLENNEMQGK